jgi:hypothetical protein
VPALAAYQPTSGYCQADTIIQPQGSASVQAWALNSAYHDQPAMVISGLDDCLVRCDALSACSAISYGINNGNGPNWWTVWSDSWNWCIQYSGTCDTTGQANLLPGYSEHYTWTKPPPTPPPTPALTGIALEIANNPGIAYGCLSTVGCSEFRLEVEVYGRFPLYCSSLGSQFEEVQSSNDCSNLFGPVNNRIPATSSNWNWPGCYTNFNGDLYWSDGSDAFAVPARWMQVCVTSSTIGQFRL